MTDTANLRYQRVLLKLRNVPWRRLRLAAIVVRLQPTRRASSLPLNVIVPAASTG